MLAQNDTLLKNLRQARECLPFVLFYVFVVVNMIDAVAVIALTTGAVPELQVRVADVRAAADGTTVSIGGLCGRGLICLCI